MTITTGLVDTSTTPQLLRLMAGGRLTRRRWRPTGSNSKRWRRRTTSFADAATANALKVVLSAHPLFVAGADQLAESRT